MKVTIVGAGNVGASCAEYIAQKQIASKVVLLDIKEGFAEGKALDLFQSAKEMQTILDPKFSEIYLAVKKLEHSEYLHVISPWEREHLLLNV